ncbi:MAG: sugar transferase [Desulfotomaculaceae bacterium]|nr:sugar transferase [Desulfotomaculaceae bacterium]
MSASSKLQEFTVNKSLLSKCDLYIKHLLDLIFSLILFIICLPLLLTFAVWIPLDSKGPILFIQKRLGKNGKIFNCYKFRTMVQDAETALKRSLENDPVLKNEWQYNFKLKNDQRITRIGSFLRKTSLDELPQMLNVIRGEMSLVGPRPRPLYELAGRENDEIFQLGLCLRPGITGLWQVSGRNELDFHHRIWLDAVYVQKRSLWFDISLLFRTISIVLRQKGAY